MSTPPPISPHLLGRTYNDAERARRAGLVTLEQFQAYAYRWRDGGYRYSAVGRTDATAHARRYALPLPYSDRKVTEAERDAHYAHLEAQTTQNQSGGDGRPCSTVAQDDGEGVARSEAVAPAPAPPSPESVGNPEQPSNTHPEQPPSNESEQPR